MEKSEIKQSIQVIEAMLKETKRSLQGSSFFFILWGILLMPAGIIESAFFGAKLYWVVWPIIGILGGIISTIYSRRAAKHTNGVTTFADKMLAYTWGAFIFTLFFSINYSVYHSLSPSPMVLMLAGLATFISGGIAKFKPLVMGAIFLEIGAILCGFIFSAPYHGYIFAVSILLGYVVPGIMLRKSENEQT